MVTIVAVNVNDNGINFLSRSERLLSLRLKLHKVYFLRAELYTFEIITVKFLHIRSVWQQQSRPVGGRDGRMLDAVQGSYSSSSS